MLGALAASLKQPVPPVPRRSQPPRPFIGTAALLGTNDARSEDGGFGPGKGNWTTTKWFLEGHGRYAEVFVNVSMADGEGELSEKDPEYRVNLVREFAWVLRDGEPLPRTVEDDPNLVEHGPQAIRFQKVLERQPGDVAFDSSTFFHTVWRDGDETSVLTIGSAGAPPTTRELLRYRGPLQVASCRELRPVRCVVEEVIPSMKGTISTDDQRKLWLVIEGRAPEPIKGPWNSDRGCHLPSGALSPDGRFVAIDALQQRGKRRQYAVYIHDLDEGTSTPFAVPNESVQFRAWDGQDAELSAGTPWDDKRLQPSYRVSAAAPAMKKVEMPDGHGIRSPDKLLAFTIEKDGRLVIESAAGARTFIFHPDDQGIASTDNCRWMGNRYILFDGYRPALIDVAGLKMNYLAGPEIHGGETVLSPDGKHVLYTSKDGLLYSDVGVR